MDQKNAIQIKDLTYHYGASLVLDKVNLKIPSASIYGLIGPNGAGKTTCLKLILGLLRKQEGDILIHDKYLESHRIELLRKVGSLIEEPSIYAHLTARENLLVWQKIHQCPIHKINEVLELVSLQNTGNKKAGKFSLGMKQRLGLAIALLNDPEILILDEPTNGLDPSGIFDIRQLLSKLNRDLGITIVVSSHLLAEIQKLVTNLGILHQGRLLFEGTLEQLTEHRIKVSNFYVRTDDNLKAHELLSNYFTCTQEINQVNINISSRQDISTAVRHLVKSGIDIYEVNSSNSDLETIFMDVIRQ